MQLTVWPAGRSTKSPTCRRFSGSRVRDDVETGAAARISILRAERADTRAARLVDVVVPWVERADDQVAADVDVHVLVLPVAVRAEDLGRLERVEHPRVGRIADVEGLEAEAAGDDQDVPTSNVVELALDDLRRSGHARDVLERGRDLSARRRLGSGCGARPDTQDAGQDSSDEQCRSLHANLLGRTSTTSLFRSCAPSNHRAAAREWAACLGCPLEREHQRRRTS